jgi:astacin (peptidase family M12A)
MIRLRRALAPVALASFSASVACSSGAPDAAEPVGASSQDLYGLGSLGGAWPNGVVPVCFPDLVDNGPLRQEIPIILASTWAHVANIQFTGFGACSGGNEVSVVFAALSNGLTDNLGYGPRTVTLISNDDPTLNHFTYEVIHEFGHALGFAHEMQRPDNWDGGVAVNCPPPAGSDVSQYDARPGGIYLTPTYDQLSIMNYCNFPGGQFPTTLSGGDAYGASSYSAYGPPFLAGTPAVLILRQGDSNGADLLIPTGNTWASVYAPIQIGLSGLPAGVTAYPTNAYGTSYHLTASAQAALTTTFIDITGTGGVGDQTHSISFPVSVFPKPPCTPFTCATYPLDPTLRGAQCGSPPDGCGGELSCGTCPSSDTCNNYQCAAPPPTCNPAECVCAPGYTGGGCSTSGPVGCAPCTPTSGGFHKGGCIGICQ